jgi:hypothetical protein
MNERIKELKDKLWTEEYWTNPNTDKLLPAQLEKFALLIVKECAECMLTPEIQAEPPYDKVFQATMRVLVNDMKEHFGIEE